MSNELTDVRCPCGAEFQADSYDAGFIAGSGMCQNCDAALPPKDICTCPSGDGSLRHPCPAHPAVEQAGGDERAVDGKPRATKCPDCGDGDLMPGDLCACGYETDPAAGYACSECDGSGDGYVGEVCRECDGSGWFVTPEQARAALAIASSAQAEHERDMLGQALGECIEAAGITTPGTPLTGPQLLMFAKDLKRDLKRAALAQPSPALPPFAEKVLAKLRRFNECAEDSDSGGVDIGRHWLDLLTQLGLLNRVQRSPALWEISQQGEDVLGLDVPEIEVPDSMIEKAWQRFERTLQQLETPGQAEQAEQAEAERPEVVAWQYRVTAGPQTGWSLWHPGKGEEFERSYTVERRPLMTVAQHERIVGELRAERDGAIKLLGQSVWQKIERLTQERDAALARVAELESKLAELEKQEPVALANRGIHAFWVKWTEAAAGLYGPGIKLYAHPVAQAQHSVPEGVTIERDVAGTIHIKVGDFDFIQLQYQRPYTDNASTWKLAERIASLLAAAPGKEVPQAWLDVQAERRRQITAEGWTPEHDDLYCAAELPRAAAAYILNGANDEAPAIWPFSAKWWKPRDARANYVRAGALILAEIERLDRARQGGRS